GLARRPRARVAGLAGAPRRGQVAALAWGVALPRIAGGIDPLVRLLVLAILLASFLPVTGEHRPIAVAVSNGAIFVLFLLNGLRLPRAEVPRGMRSEERRGGN